jgi:hypothetical protein
MAVVIRGGEIIEAEVIVGADGKSTINPLPPTHMPFRCLRYVFIDTPNFQISVEHQRAKRDQFQVSNPPSEGASSQIRHVFAIAVWI